MNIHEVAQAAGVSVATVSRVINHPEIVAEKTRDRVLAALEKTCYTPNSETRARQAKKKHVIAVVLPSLLEYGNVQSGVCQIAGAKNCSVGLYLSAFSEAELQRIVRSLIAQQVDGVILASDGSVHDAFSQLREAGIPLVCIGGFRKPDMENLCYINYRETAFRLAHYAVDSGNERVALLIGHNESDSRQSLMEGFLQGWTDAGKPKESVSVIPCEESFKGGYLSAETLWDASVPPPDLILAQFDEMAVGAIKAAAERHINVPKDIHVIGFHDTPVSTAILPELTSVEQPTHRLGIAAARRLFDIIEDQEYFDIESQEIVLKGRIKIRKSCGNKKAIYELYE